MKKKQNDLSHITCEAIIQIKKSTAMMTTPTQGKHNKHQGCHTKNKIKSYAHTKSTTFVIKYHETVRTFTHSLTQMIRKRMTHEKKVYGKNRRKKKY